MQLHRLVLEWSGVGVTGRAVTVLHYDGTEQPAPPVAAVLAALNASKALFPENMKITVPGAGETIDDNTGSLLGVWSSAGGGTVTGTAAGATVLGVGACITWRTGTIVRGRRLRGRTFLVPLGAFVWEPNGTFSASALTQIQTLANALQATGGLAVWSRPTGELAGDGDSGAVLSNSVRDVPAVLTSRRD